MRRLLFGHRFLCAFGCVLFGCSISFGLTASYIPGLRDDKVLDAVERRVNELVEADEKVELVSLSKALVERLDELKDDPQAQYLLYEILQLIQHGFEEVIRDWGEEQQRDAEQSAANPGTTQGIISSISPNDTRVFMSEKQREDYRNEYVIRETVPEKDGPREVETHSGEEQEEVIVEVPTPDKSFSKENFYKTYMPYVMTQETPISEACVVHYDAIDAVAKKHDFPTSLILAMWRREHSCHLSNPANGRGNFQITSYRYEPGDVTLDELLIQVEHFIAFSKNKRQRYDVIQVYDERPIAITYDTFDLNSIRKHAILYNGVYPEVTLENSRYSNDNFTTTGRARDGIVAVVLKALEREKENGKW